MGAGREGEERVVEEGRGMVVVEGAVVVVGMVCWWLGGCIVLYARVGVVVRSARGCPWCWIFFERYGTGRKGSVND